MLHLYYNVPPCPKCGSKVTGRFVKRPYADTLYVLRKAYHAGELIRFVEKEEKNNCYCEECDYKWARYITASLITDEQRETERRNRYTAIRAENLEAEYKKANRSNNGLFGAIWNNAKVLIGKDPNAATEVELERDAPDILYVDPELIREVLTRNAGRSDE